MLIGLIIGVAGGALFHVIHFPAPWLAGSMIASVVATYAGIRIDVPGWLRALAFILLGIQTGGSVTTDTFERAAQWPLSIALLGITVIVVTLACAQFFRRRFGWDSSTALFASLPGALSLSLALADEAGADMRRVTISQCIRLFFLVAALPAVIASISPVPTNTGPLHYPDLPHILILLVASSAGGFLFERLRIPAGMILGAIAVSAGLYLTGAVEGATPDAILIPANVILGVMIGSRFQGLPLAEVRKLFGEGLAGFLLALAISSTGAGLAAYFGGLPLSLTLLAFAPGGLEAMTIMSFALNLDPAYVAAHQVARYLGIAIFMPPIAAWLLSRRRLHVVVTPVSPASRLQDD